MKLLFGSTAYNPHVRHMAESLREAGLLVRYNGTALDCQRHPAMKCIRSVSARFVPSIDNRLKSRYVPPSLEALTHSDWTWDIPRLLSQAAGMGPQAEDWFWERGEYRLDSRCAQAMRSGRYDIFFGTEHGCAKTIQTCVQVGKMSAVVFLSLHHSFREKWVDKEYEKFPELLSLSTRALLEWGKKRDARRDEEMMGADIVVTNSALTTQSLVSAGVSADKIMTVPLGAPPCSERPSPVPTGKSAIFMYAGSVSVGKGVHYLIDAWHRLRAQDSACLRMYGRQLLPESIIASAKSVSFFGRVSQQELFGAYAGASFLVFPTLCDGFGAVVLEAMSRGLPVITTRNAGASEFVREGENGYLVPAGDAEALASVMDRCLRERGRWPQMRLAAWETAKNWTWNHFKSDFKEKFSALLAAKGCFHAK